MADLLHRLLVLFRRRSVAGSLFFTLCAAGALHAQPLRAADDPAQAFRPAWTRLGDTAGWQMLVSAPFPQDWPLPAERRQGVVRYAFAMRLRGGLSDGVEIASPWAWSLESAGGMTTVAVFQSTIHPLGIQGVRPLRAGEGELAGHGAKVAALLRFGSDPASADLIRTYTCNWIDRQGVVAAAIMPLHPSFTRWLACQSLPVNP